MLTQIASLWIYPYDVEDVLELIALPQLNRLRSTVHQNHRCPAVCLQNWPMTTQTVSFRAEAYASLIILMTRVLEHPLVQHEV